MSTATIASRPDRAGTGNGGVPARRAVIRWAWRLFRRQWRQQLLVLGLLTVAVAATMWGVGVATNTPPPATATFGTATAAISLPGTDPHLAAEIAQIGRNYGPIDVIENQVLSTGSTQSVELRAQNPAGRFGRPLLALDSGHYPAGPGQVALTSQVASLYDVKAGGTWHADGRSWLVTGIVENPADLNDEFALVAPGKVTTPTQVTILVNAPQGAGQNQDQVTAGPPPPVFAGLPADANVSLAGQSGHTGIISPATIVLVVAVLGLVFIGLVSVAAFTVMAQRRLRALGMLAALGATERNVRLVMTANGAAVGLTATVVGVAAGFGAWFAYVPSLEARPPRQVQRVDPVRGIGHARQGGASHALRRGRAPGQGRQHRDPGQPGPFPQIRVVGLGESGTRAVLGAALSGLATGEQALLRQLLPRLSPGDLLLADRNFLSHGLLKEVLAAGVHVLWRAKADVDLPVLRVLPDGTYLSRIADPEASRKMRRKGADPRDIPGIEVRVIEYTVESEDGSESSETFALVTDILDAELLSCEQAAAAYASRWQLETCFDELETSMRGGAAVVLRSKSPPMIRQEIYAMLCCYQAIRTLIAGAASEEGIDPRRVSFTVARDAVRRRISDPGSFPP